jgi:hypothetical protein
MALPPATTVQGILTDALMDAGIIGIDEAIEQPVLNRAFTQANRMLAQWNNKRYLVFRLKNYGFVSTGAQSYTVGAGQNFDINPRPDRLESAFLRQLQPAGGQQIDWPLSIIPARENYDQIILKTLGTFSVSIWYDTAWPIGFVYPWPIPQAGIYEIHITVKDQLKQFASLQEQIMLPPEYEAALEWCLARRFRASYQLPADPTIDSLARDGLNTIRLANVQVPTLTMPSQLRERNMSYNYKSDYP